MVQMQCCKCGCKISGAGFLGYLEGYLVEVLEKVVVQAIIEWGKYYLSAPSKKGCFDENMAALSNYFNIACPQCKNVAGWKAVPEQRQEEQLPEEKRTKQLSM